jgi:RND superfamily putative drug exporter
VILALAAPSALVRLGAADQGTQPTAQTSRRAYDLLAEGFGPGFNGPIPIVVDVNDDPQAAQKIYDRVENLPGVASVAEPQLNDEETVGIVFVTPDSAPQDAETDELVDRLRAELRHPPVSPGEVPPGERKMISAVRDLVEARARLAQISRELRRAESA